MNINTAETEKQIKQAFDGLLDNATLTPEQVQHISDYIESATAKDNQMQKMINDLPSNNGVSEVPVNALANPSAVEEVKATVRIDPALGSSTVESIVPDDDDIPAADLNDYLNMADYENGTINLECAVLSESTLKEYGIKAEESDQIVELLKRVQKKEEFDYYAELPESLKKYCDLLVSFEKKSSTPKDIKLRDTALSTLEAITSEIAADKFTIDISEVIDSEIKKSGVDLSDIYEGMIIGKADSLRKAADKTEEDGHEKEAAILRKIADSCEESYLMTGFIDAIKNHKIKIRKIDIEKPQKVVRDFNTKYETSKIGINDVWDLTYCIPRNLCHATETPDPDVITMDTIKAFVVGFCRYCSNMKITNIEDHTFMYYFIKNILYLDITAPGAEFTEFGQQLIDRIKSILDTIHEVYGY